MEKVCAGEEEVGIVPYDGTYTSLLLPRLGHSYDAYLTNTTRLTPVEPLVGRLTLSGASSALALTAALLVIVRVLP